VFASTKSYTKTTSPNQLVLLLKQHRGGATTTTRPVTSLSLSSAIETEQQQQQEDMTIMGTLTPQEKVDAVRAKMKELNLDVYLVPTDDPHLSGTSIQKGDMHLVVCIYLIEYPNV
jgi:ribosomal protein L11